MKALVAAIGLVTILAACGEPLAESQVSNPRNLWEQQQLHNYQFVVQQQCFCLRDYTRPMQVTVNNNKIVSAVFIDDQLPVGADILKDLRSIDQWFRYLDAQKGNAYHQFSVQYHATQGYPTKIIIDKDERIADDTLDVTLSNLKPL